MVKYTVDTSIYKGKYQVDTKTPKIPKNPSETNALDYSKMPKDPAWKRNMPYKKKEIIIPAGAKVVNKSEDAISIKEGIHNKNKESILGSLKNILKHAKTKLLNKAKDKLPGGKGDKKNLSEFPKQEVEMGKKAESEHTKDPKIAKEITADHLTENKHYYSKLKDSGLADELKKDVVKFDPSKRKVRDVAIPQKPASSDGRSIAQKIKDALARQQGVSSKKEEYVPFQPKLNDASQVAQKPEYRNPADRMLARFDSNDHEAKILENLKITGHTEPYIGRAIENVVHASPSHTRYRFPLVVGGPVHLGGELGKFVKEGGADPFSWMEAKYGKTKEVLQENKDKPLKISTRSDLIAHDDYMKHLNPDLHEINIHIMTDNSSAAREMEPGAPSTKRRLQAAEKLKNAGFKVNIIHDKVKGVHEDHNSISSIKGFPVIINNIEDPDRTKHAVKLSGQLPVSPTKLKLVKDEETKKVLENIMNKPAEDLKKTGPSKLKKLHSCLRTKIEKLKKDENLRDFYEKIKEENEKEHTQNAEPLLIAYHNTYDGQIPVVMATHPDHKNLIGWHHVLSSPVDPKEKSRLLEHPEIEDAIDSAINQGFPRVVLHQNHPRDPKAKAHLKVIKSKGGV